MKRVSPYLKMRVLGAIEYAPGASIVARIRHVAEASFTDEDGRRFQFTWRTIQTWYSRYKKDGITNPPPIPGNLGRKAEYPDDDGGYVRLRGAAYYKKPFPIQGKGAPKPGEPPPAATPPGSPTKPGE